MLCTSHIAGSSTTVLELVSFSLDAIIAVQHYDQKNVDSKPRTHVPLPALRYLSDKGANL